MASVRKGPPSCGLREVTRLQQHGLGGLTAASEGHYREGRVRVAGYGVGFELGSLERWAEALGARWTEGFPRGARREQGQRTGGLGPGQETGDAQASVGPTSPWVARALGPLCPKACGRPQRCALLLFVV